MKLNSQGPPVSYAQAASKQPKKNTITKESVCLCNTWIKDAQWDKEKAATQATLDHITQQEWSEEAAQKIEEEWQAKKACLHETQWRLAKEGAELQE